MARSSVRWGARSAAAIGITAGRRAKLIGYVLPPVFPEPRLTARQRYWTFTIIGYCINLLAVPLMALANHWGIAAALIIAERAGIISDSHACNATSCCRKHPKSSDVVGVFGLHEFMDQFGAFLGPLMVAPRLEAGRGNYSSAYALLTIPGGPRVGFPCFTAIKFYPDSSRF